MEALFSYDFMKLLSTFSTSSARRHLEETYEARDSRPR